MFIAFEGIGGAGKSTVVAKVHNWLRDQDNLEWVGVREPGGTPHAEQIRRLVKEGFPGLDIALDPMGVALLFNAARIDLTNKVILPEMAQGKLVLSDRYCDSTFAYQSVYNGLELEVLTKLHDTVVGLYPKWTYLLDCPGEIANARVSSEERAADQFDRAGIEKQEAMRQTYLQLADRAPGRYVVIDATQPEEIVAEQVISHLRDSIVLWKGGNYVYSSPMVE